MANKGSGFEREICKELSLWWTYQRRDDVFWRSSTSGARATMRAKSGKKTANSHGDITFIDPIGAPLIDCLSIELKRGYKGASFQELLDRTDTTRSIPKYETFIEQAIASWNASGTFCWALIIRRDSRQATITVPHWFYKDLKEAGAFPAHCEVPGQVLRYLPLNGDPRCLFTTTLKSFLIEVTPTIIRNLTL